MKSKIKKLDGTARQLHIEVPQEIVDKAFKEVLEEIGKTAKVPGFRPGNVPMDILQKNYQADAKDEVLRRLIPEAYQQVLTTNGIKPVSFPEISDVELGPSGILTFKAKADIYPEINLKKYKGLKVTSEKISVKDEEVEEELKKARNMHADFDEVDRPIKKGDFAICDMEALIDNEVISKKRENAWIEAEKDASMLGMGEELIGLKKGDKKDIEVTLPENYPDKKYAGKKATFKIEVKGVKEKKLPEMDDELAKKLGKDTLDELREEIKSQLFQSKEFNNKIAMKNQISEQLLKGHNFDLPVSMIERQQKVLEEKAENELLQKGLDKETIEAHKGELKGRLSKEAENKVKLYFILEMIAEKEDVQVSDEEIDNWLQSLASYYNRPIEEVKKYYQEHDLLGGLKEQLREEKTLDFILQEATVSSK